MRAVLLVFAIWVSAAADAETPAPQPAAYGSPITMNDALTLVNRGIELSKARGLKVSIAVVEPSGELVAFARMDDATYASIQLAQAKARTSARFRIATADAEQRVQNGRVALITVQDYIALGGGVPIISNDRVVGAVGVSGGSAAEDAALAAEIIFRK